MAKRIRVQVGGRWHVVEVGDVRTSPVRVLVDGEAVDVDVEGLPRQEIPSGSAGADGITIARPVTHVRAPMAGVIVSVAVKAGQTVARGDDVCVLEALKLQQAIRSPAAGVVKAVHVQPGQSVASGQELLEVG